MTQEEKRLKKIQRAKDWQKNNRERYNARLREWRARRPAEEKRRVYLQQKAREKAYTGEKRERRLETFRRNSARFRANSSEEQKLRDRASKQKYKKANRHKDRAYNAKRRATNIQFAIASRLRSRLGMALRYHQVKKYNSTFALLGCTIDFFMGYLEAQFKDGMSWANRKRWHIDHIRPCAKFDLTDPAEQARCFNYTNLQPLWRIDNLRKGAD